MDGLGGRVGPRCRLELELDLGAVSPRSSAQGVQGPRQQIVLRRGQSEPLGQQCSGAAAGFVIALERPQPHVRSQRSGTAIAQQHGLLQGQAKHGLALAVASGEPTHARAHHGHGQKSPHPDDGLEAVAQPPWREVSDEAVHLGHGCAGLGPSRLAAAFLPLQHRARLGHLVQQHLSPLVQPPVKGVVPGALDRGLSLELERVPLDQQPLEAIRMGPRRNEEVERARPHDGALCTALLRETIAWRRSHADARAAAGASARPSAAIPTGEAPWRWPAS